MNAGTTDLVCSQLDVLRSDLGALRFDLAAAGVARDHLDQLDRLADFTGEISLELKASTIAADPDLEAGGARRRDCCRCTTPGRTRRTGTKTARTIADDAAPSENPYEALLVEIRRAIKSIIWMIADGEHEQATQRLETCSTRSQTGRSRSRHGHWTD